MKPPIRYGLIDVNSFYCSVEAVFNPRLQGAAVVVLSNNDGCCVARSHAAKRLGVKMGEPWHLARKRGGLDEVVALSSNYCLYDAMSNRVMQIIAEAAPRSEVYSVDEAFVDLTGVQDTVGFGRMIRARLLEWLGLPTCVGIGSTKTRSKLANAIAKKTPAMQGVFDLESLSADEVDALFASLPADEVWGIGRRLLPRLEAIGIRTVKDLRDADAKQVRAHFSVLMEKTIAELRGISCIPLEMAPPKQKQIMCSRSFSREVTTYDELRQAVITYVSRAAEKLRCQHALAGSIMVFAHTNQFKDVEQYSRAITLHMPDATDDTLTLARYATLALTKVWKKGFRFKKAGTMLLDLQPVSMRQATLLDDSLALARRRRLNTALDSVNSKFGRGTLVVAGAGLEKPWAMQRANLSPDYMTRWDQLPEAR